MVVKNQIKFIKSLQQKKYRNLHGLFVAEGIKLVKELLHTPIKAVEVYTTEEGMLESPATEVSRISVAELKELSKTDDPSRWSHVRVATKYPNLTAKYFARRGVQAECIKLNGAMELAPSLGLCRRIVDLVSTGATLKANGLVEVEKILDITSRFIINRTAFKTRNAEIDPILENVREALDG